MIEGSPLYLFDFWQLQPLDLATKGTSFRMRFHILLKPLSEMPTDTPNTHPKALLWMSTPLQRASLRVHHVSRQAGQALRQVSQLGKKARK